MTSLLSEQFPIAVCGEGCHLHLLFPRLNNIECLNANRACRAEQRNTHLLILHHRLKFYIVLGINRLTIIPELELGQSGTALCIGPHSTYRLTHLYTVANCFQDL